MSFHRIRRQEAPGVGLIVPRPQVVRAQVGVVLLAAIQIRVRRRAGLMQDHAVGVIRITVGDVPRRVAQSPNAPHPVGVIIAHRAQSRPRASLFTAEAEVSQIGWYLTRSTPLKQHDAWLSEHFLLLN